MSHGGKRPKAGRPPGAINRVTQEAVERAAEGGEMPLDYMLRVMRDISSDTQRRDDMAKAAAGYCHHKLTSTDSTVKADITGGFTWLPTSE